MTAPASTSATSYIYHHIPKLRELLTEQAGRPGVSYLQVTTGHARQAQDDGWSPIEGSLTYTISSSPGWEGMVSFLALHEHVTGRSKELNQQIMLPITAVTKDTIDDKTKVVPWEVDPVWLDLTRKYFPRYNGLY